MALRLGEHVHAFDPHGSGEHREVLGQQLQQPMAVVDLPDPDSPMMVTVSPRWMVKLTASTALKTPLSVISSTLRSLTSSTAVRHRGI